MDKFSKRLVVSVFGVTLVILTFLMFLGAIFSLSIGAPDLSMHINYYTALSNISGLGFFGVSASLGMIGLTGLFVLLLLIYICLALVAYIMYALFNIKVINKLIPSSFLVIGIGHFVVGVLSLVVPILLQNDTTGAGAGLFSIGSIFFLITGILIVLIWFFMREYIDLSVKEGSLLLSLKNHKPLIVIGGKENVHKETDKENEEEVTEEVIEKPKKEVNVLLIVTNFLAIVLSVFTFLMLLSGAVNVYYNNGPATGFSYYSTLNGMNQITDWTPMTYGVYGLFGIITLLMILWNVVIIIFPVLSMFLKNKGINKFTKNIFFITSIIYLVLGTISEVLAGIVMVDIETTAISPGGICFIIFGIPLLVVSIVYRKKLTNIYEVKKPEVKEEVVDELVIKE